MICSNWYLLNQFIEKKKLKNLKLTDLKGRFAQQLEPVTPVHWKEQAKKNWFNQFRENN